MKTQKIVTVLNVYKFKSPLNRICFEILSSDETTKYNTCFNGSASHAACGCDRFVKGHKECYHIEQLRPRAQAYFDERETARINREMAFSA